MYKLFLIGAVITATVFAAPKDGYADLALAESCNNDKCKLPDCRCSSTNIPGNLKPSETPQLVFLTFDDAVNVANYPYYEQAFFGRNNPDGCPIGTTYFVSHEYTDYSKVHDLWARGHEIALHSITHQTPTTYWQEASVDELLQQFADQIDLISNFADIPANEVLGLRLPFLQQSGNNSYEVIARSTLKYDCSWPTQSNIEPGLWPYTLDYKSTQDCPIGPCPTASLPGVWVVPMIMWIDGQGSVCSMVDSCLGLPTEVDALTQFMIDNFNRQYVGNKAPGNRAPFGFYVHAAWFAQNPAVNFEAYLKFLDYLQSLDDVYLVSIQRGLEWIQNPSSLGNLQQSWPSCQPVSANTCGVGRSCRLLKGEEERYMTSCAPCPAVYPWLGNPLGQGTA